MPSPTWKGSSPTRNPSLWGLVPAQSWRGGWHDVPAAPPGPAYALDMDGRRERLDLVVADLQSGKVMPVDQATARDRIEKRIRDRRTR
jgi:hypothetical protein